MAVGGCLRWTLEYGSLKKMLLSLSSSGKIKVDSHYGSMMAVAGFFDLYVSKMDAGSLRALSQDPLARKLASEFFYHYTTVTVGKGKPVLAEFFSSLPSDVSSLPIPQEDVAAMIRQQALLTTNLAKLVPRGRGFGRGRGGYGGRGYGGRGFGGRGRGFPGNQQQAPQQSQPLLPSPTGNDNNSNSYRGNSGWRGRGGYAGYGK
jgi:hypothetical protein